MGRPGVVQGCLLSVIQAEDTMALLPGWVKQPLLEYGRCYYFNGRQESRAGRPVVVVTGLGICP
jgi:hypothetical protein